MGEEELLLEHVDVEEVDGESGFELVPASNIECHGLNDLAVRIQKVIEVPYQWIFRGREILALVPNVNGVSQLHLNNGFLVFFQDRFIDKSGVSVVTGRVKVGDIIPILPGLQFHGLLVGGVKHVLVFTVPFEDSSSRDDADCSKKKSDGAHN